MARGRGTGAVRVHPVRENVGFALAKACKAHRGNVGGLLAEHGLHVGQEMVLVELYDEDGLRGGELAGRLGVEPPTVTKMLRRLENMGLVRRRRDPGDARSFRAYLTDGGRALEGPVARSFESAEKRALDGVSPADRETLRRLLEEVRENLERTPGTGEAASAAAEARKGPRNADGDEKDSEIREETADEL